MNTLKIFDSCGRLRVELRRVLAGLTAASLCYSSLLAAVNYAGATTYVETAARTGRADNLFSFMESSQNPTTAGIQTGRVYASKNPVLVQTPKGQDVFNDRRVVDLTRTGSGLTDFDVKFTEPGNTSPTVEPASLFMAWAGQDVTESLPPVAEGAGQTGEGHNWRPYSGGGVQQTSPVAQSTTPGVYNAPLTGPTGHTENGEKEGVTRIEVASTPAEGPHSDSVGAIAQVGNFNNDNGDGRASQTLRQQSQERGVSQPAQDAAAQAPAQASNDNTASADAGSTGGESLRSRALKH